MEYYYCNLTVYYKYTKPDSAIYITSPSTARNCTFNKGKYVYVCYSYECIYVLIILIVNTCMHTNIIRYLYKVTILSHDSKLLYLSEQSIP